MSWQPKRDLIGYGANPPDPKWPGGARLAINFVVNFEEGSEPSVQDGEGYTETGLTESSTSSQGLKGRDLAGEGMFEYGSRAGFWRLHDLFVERGVEGGHRLLPPRHSRPSGPTTEPDPRWAAGFDRDWGVPPAAQAPKIEGGNLTLEGWFALGAYPWNWAPIVRQGDDDGYFPGVDGHGYPAFMAKVGGKWQQLGVPSQPPYGDENHLALFRWYHYAVGAADVERVFRAHGAADAQRK